MKLKLLEIVIKDLNFMDLIHFIAVDLGKVKSLYCLSPWDYLSTYDVCMIDGQECILVIL